MNPIEKIFLCAYLSIIIYVAFNWRGWVDVIRTENEDLERQGCHCPKGILGWIKISPECPVHKSQCTVSHHRNWYGSDYVIYPHTEVDRVMMCQKCFDKLSEEKLEMFYHKGTGKCGVCGTKNQLCIRVPSNLVDDWVKGKTFHFSWKKTEKEDYEKQGIEASVNSPQ